MTREERELRNQASTLKAEARDLVSKNDMTSAKAKAEEAKNLIEKADLLAELEEKEQPKAPISTGEQNDLLERKQQYQNAFMKNFRGVKLDAEERQLLNEGEEPPVTGLHSEPDENGGLLLPKDVQTAINQYKRSLSQLEPFITVTPVTTLSGTRVYEKLATMTPLEELTADDQDIPETDNPMFESISYKIRDFGGWLPVPNNLRNDSDQNILTFLQKWFARKSVVTRNKYILEILTALSPSTFANYKAIKKALNVTLDPMGSGYNEERKKGLQAQNDYLSGDSGEQAKEANRLIGQYKASLENDREEAIRRAEKGAMETVEYNQARIEGDGAEMGRILSEARVKAENEYRLSKGYQQQVETDKTLVENIRDSMIEDGVYQKYGYEMGLEFNKGMASTTAARYAILAPPSISQQEKAAAEKSLANSAKSGAGGMVGYGGSRGQAPALDQYPGRQPAGKAFGMARVPYNDFPAMLHEGERVLTASEARAQKTAPTIHVTVTGNVIKDEVDEDRIAQKIVTKILNAMQITN